MEEEKENKKIRLKSDNDDFLDLDIAVSSTECTGLIPTPPLSVDEAKSYTEIYDIPLPKVKADNGLQHK